MQALDAETFAAIGALMHHTCGLSFNDSKRMLVGSRLAPRVLRLGLPGYREYLDLIQSGMDPEEFQTAVDLLTTNETYFFREPRHFELLEEEFRHGLAISPKIWSAAASFGDEAYSIAMLLSDLQMQGRVGPDWRVLGTDISDRVLRAASEAVFPEERLRDVSAERLKRHCLRGEGDAEGLVQMHPRLRERVRFGQLNLCRPIEDLGPFDAVFLRNVLIYFDAATKVEVVDRVLTQLKPGGLFFLGTAEGRVNCRTRLKPLAPGAFRKDAA